MGCKVERFFLAAQVRLQRSLQMQGIHILEAKVRSGALTSDRSVRHVCNRNPRSCCCMVKTH